MNTITECPLCKGRFEQLITGKYICFTETCRYSNAPISYSDIMGENFGKRTIHILQRDDYENEINR